MLARGCQGLIAVITNAKRPQTTDRGRSPFFGGLRSVVSGRDALWGIGHNVGYSKSSTRTTSLSARSWRESRKRLPSGK